VRLRLSLRRLPALRCATKIAGTSPLRAFSTSISRQRQPLKIARVSCSRRHRMVALRIVMLLKEASTRQLMRLHLWTLAPTDKVASNDKCPTRFAAFPKTKAVVKGASIISSSTTSNQLDYRWPHQPLKLSNTAATRAACSILISSSIACSCKACTKYQERSRSEHAVFRTQMVRVRSSILSLTS